MDFTPDTSHFEMSPINKCALENKQFMSVTPDTSHSPIGPCIYNGALEQSPFGDTFRHAPMALLSSTVDCGENAGMCLYRLSVVRVGGAMEPNSNH